MRGLANDVLAILGNQFWCHMERHYNFLDGHETLPAEFEKAQAEAVADAARAVAKNLGVEEPEWLRTGTKSSE